MSTTKTPIKIKPLDPAEAMELRRQVLKKLGKKPPHPNFDPLSNLDDALWLLQRRKLMLIRGKLNRTEQKLYWWVKLNHVVVTAPCTTAHEALCRAFLLED